MSLQWLDLLHGFKNSSYTVNFKMFTNVCTTVLMFHNEADFHNPNKFINAVGLFLSYFNDVSQQPE